MAIIQTQIKKDIDEVERLLSGLGRDADKVITRALNRTLRAVNTQAVRFIAEDMGITQKRVRINLSQHRARQRRSRAYIEASGKRIPLLAFNARQVRRGVTYRSKGDQRKSIAGAFRQTMQSGHEGIFRRTGRFTTMKRGTYAGKRREQITELHGASIPYIMVQQKVKQAMDEKGADSWKKEIRNQLQYYVRSKHG